MPNKYHEQFNQLIALQNFSRLKYLSISGIVILIFFIINDVFITGQAIYIIYDVFLLLFNIFYLVSYYLFLPKKSDELKNYHYLGFQFYGFILINWSAYLSSFEIAFQTHIYSYLMTIFVVTVIFDLKTRYLFFILAAGFFTHIVSNYQNYGFLISPGKDMYILSAHFLCVLISRKIYGEKIKSFLSNCQLIESNNRLNEEIKNRLNVEEELKAITHSLEERVSIRTKELEDEIIHRKSTLDALEESRKALDLKNYELQKLKKEMDLFVYRTSHDIRGPISSVFGLLMLIKSSHDASLKELLLQKIKKSMDQIDVFIQDILEYSENSRAPLEQNQINFHQVIEEILNKIRDRYDVEIDVNVEVISEETFICDERRLRIILKNLLCNSFMFQMPLREDKRIRIKVDTLSSINTAIIQVIDNGIGIKNECLDKVFKMFYRGTDGSKGAGLGLYITKLAIDKLAGSIKVDSKLSEYTCVTCHIPYQFGPLSSYNSHDVEKVRIFN